MNLILVGKDESNVRARGRAAVVVLGDIGRSPRMQYHALSLARQVCVCAFYKISEWLLICYY